MDWSPLGAVAPADLGAARNAAHHAVQVIAAAGETHRPHVPDTSHTAASWDPRLGAFVGGEAAGLRVGLRVADLALLVLDADGVARASHPLAGGTLADARDWAAHALERHSGGALAGPLADPGFALPEHPLGDGARFEADATALAELARWYGNAHGALSALAARTAGAGPVLVWPHHFDIATLVTLERDGEGEATKTVGVGLSPGDGYDAAPYWYVNHWPGPDEPKLPALAVGEWHTEDWTGAVLRAESLVAAGGASAQAARLSTFLDSAIAASRTLLG